MLLITWTIKTPFFFLRACKSVKILLSCLSVRLTVRMEQPVPT